jgi:hypothetical protein
MYRKENITNTHEEGKPVVNKLKIIKEKGREFRGDLKPIKDNQRNIL